MPFDPLSANATIRPTFPVITVGSHPSKWRPRIV
jgi:hypothetical protein